MVEYGRGSRVVWGCMCPQDVSELHFIEEIVNSQMYCNILANRL